MYHPCHHALATPDKPAYVMARTGETVTYRQLEERSNQGAHLFRSLGLKRGDSIALMMDNNARYFEICFAAQRSGLLFTAMSSRLSTQEAEYILADCGAKALIVSASLAAQAADLLGKNPQVRTRYSVNGALPGYPSWEAARDAQPVTRIADESAGRDMLYSSGTTGRPKGVKTELLDEAIDATSTLMMVAKKLYGLGGDSIYLSPAPLYHAAPLRFNMTVMRFGGTSVIMEHFDAEEALRLIERHAITHSQWVPTMFVRMLKLPPRSAFALPPRFAQSRDPRRGAVPGAGEGGHDRLVGAGAVRVLRGDGRQRVRRLHLGRLAQASRHRGQRAGGRGAHPG